MGLQRVGHKSQVTLSSKSVDSKEGRGQRTLICSRVGQNCGSPGALTVTGIRWGTVLWDQALNRWGLRLQADDVRSGLNCGTPGWHCSQVPGVDKTPVFSDPK